MAAKNPTGEPDPAPFKIHLMTRAGRVMRARTGPVRAFSTKDEAVRFAGRQLGGQYAVYHKHRKIWPAWSLLRGARHGIAPALDQNQLFRDGHHIGRSDNSA
jgi:hypothetical protein